MADVPIATRAAHIYIHILDPLENYDDSDIITVDVRKRGGRAELRLTLEDRPIPSTIPNVVDQVFPLLACRCKYILTIPCIVIHHCYRELKESKHVRKLQIS